MTIRVLVVDDSVVVRRSIANVLDQFDDIDVIGTASDGRLGLRRIEELRPDVVTLDIEMPGMDGLEALAHIRRDHPRLPVIMYSTLTERGATATFDALALGAVDYATKPTNAPNRDQVSEQLRESLVPLVRLWGVRQARAPRPAVVRTSPAPATPFRAAQHPARPGTKVEMIVVGVSTGGPDALAALIPTLPADLPVPMVIVQHMPPVFTSMLARRLDQLSPLQVTEAVGGERPQPGHVYVAPGAHHLEITAAAAGPVLAVTDGPAENSCRPAVDVLFRTATDVFGGNLLAVVLTGMGQDGMLGARQVRSAGGAVLVQDEESSVVWGMPGAVVRDDGADAVLPLAEIGMGIAGRLRQSIVAGAR